jgi:hypothetical protein
VRGTGQTAFKAMHISFVLNILSYFCFKKNILSYFFFTKLVNFFIKRLEQIPIASIYFFQVD